MNMKEWIEFLDKGKISALEAKLKAESEYEKYRVVQDKKYLSDFDRLLLDMKKDLTV